MFLVGNFDIFLLAGKILFRIFLGLEIFSQNKSSAGEIFALPGRIFADLQTR